MFFDEDYSPEKKFGPFWVIFGLFSDFHYFFNFRFFLFFKYLIMSEVLAIIFIWKVTSRPLIWPPSDCYFIHLKWRYVIFNDFLIFWNFPSSKVFSQPPYRILFSNAFFLFFDHDYARKKNVCTFPILGLFGTFFRLAISKTFYLHTQLTFYYQSYLRYSLNYLWKFFHMEYFVVAYNYLRGSLLPMHWQRFFHW